MCSKSPTPLVPPVQGDPNVPAGQLTLDVDLRRPLQLPDLECQQSMEELSRLVLGVHEQVQGRHRNCPFRGQKAGLNLRRGQNLCQG
uniref:Uncharacterized protein n=1 Tax=Anguilla anguilla TaxID=7936 RepID=A0A0E9ULU8_ANGAN